MTVKQQALLETLGVVLAGLAGGAMATVSMEYLGGVQTVFIVLTLLLVYLAKSAYDIRVAQLTWQRERVERALRDTK